MFRSEAYRRAVASLPCMACGREGMTQAAHNNQIGSGKGMGIKSGDETCMALCIDCHRTLDQGGKMTKIERREFENELNLKTLRLLVTEGLLKVGK
jgi:hypothetical protein